MEGSSEGRQKRNFVNKKVEIVIHYSSCFQLEPHFFIHDQRDA